MIDSRCGDILNAEAAALINPVNCVGVMGKGLALQFKRAFPANFAAYAAACQAQEIAPGRIFVFRTEAPRHRRFIVNFPTKRHWRDASRLEDIRLGLQSLAMAIGQFGIRSIALPPLGCGLGGLD